ncbi:hypothetical protein [Actinokineospora fastidiosa]|uniref:Uncharacterized protein n=1 Tax=Actinokineospora fastidiosa TaxID=1816 RepID=A0A918GLR0_9PSEU|nr:hypothetical protein [Actinokineospora fastidiosa]GGS46922.1 hypothetical protein GCM10010171_47660 [Actinokineospora fastidiosa]
MKGFRLEPDRLRTCVTELIGLAEETGELVASASRLAERLPALGTAPPAVHLAEQLRDAAGRSGLTGEVLAAEVELQSFHEALSATLTAYDDGESDIRWTLRDSAS